MNAFKGTWQLLRLAIRLDRIKLPVWILANAGLLLVTLPQLKNAYGTTEQQIAYASATAPSAVTRLLGGAITGPSIGEITIIETYMFIALLGALMNIFLVVRHTRQNEETNRSELIGSMQVGRQAPLTAALILALVANLVLTALIFSVFWLNDFPLAGSAAYSISGGLLGLTFAGIAGITVQLFESARAASGLAGLIFGLSFLIKGIGDVFGKVAPDGLSVKTNLISWFSPLGWPTNLRPFAGEIWWVLLFFVFALAGLVTGAYFLLSRRDIGSSIFAAQPGRLNAKDSLLRPFGLTWRLYKVNFFAWLGSFAVVGIVLGAVAEEFQKLIAGNEEMQKLLAAIGGSTVEITDIMFSSMFVISGIALTGYALQLLTRMRSEETAGRLELLLSTKKSRQNWLFVNLVFSLASAIFILFLTGLLAGATYALVSNGSLLENATRLGFSILVHAPAMIVTVGASLILFGILPRNFVAFSWLLLAICLIIFQLGALLDLPQWALNISPFSHTPASPANNITLRPLIAQTLIGGFLIAISFLLFRRRDLSSN